MSYHFNRRKFRASIPRAFIVRFARTNDLIELILKMKLPNEKNPIVKGNRDFRLFAKNEFDAMGQIRKLGVRPETVEEIYPMNPEK